MSVADALEHLIEAADQESVEEFQLTNSVLESASATTIGDIQSPPMQSTSQKQIHESLRSQSSASGDVGQLIIINLIYKFDMLFLNHYF